MLNLKIAFLFLFLSVFVLNINAAIWQYRKSNKTVCDDAGKCEDYCSVDGHLIKPGESFKTKECSEIFCKEDFTARGVTCGVAVENGCKMEPDFTLEYPDCCYKICGEKVDYE